MAAIDDRMGGPSGFGYGTRPGTPFGAGMAAGMVAGSRSDRPADIGTDAGAPDGAASPPSRATLLVNWVAALVSLGLIVGMAVWAWQLLVRDVAEVPVIRAIEGPMRVAPNDPGGAVAENQGLAVNRLAEGEEAAPVPDRLVLAPAPVDLAEVAPSLRPAPLPVPAPEPVASVRAEDTAALIERLLREAQPLDAADPAEGQATGAADARAGDVVQVAQVATIPVSVPGVRRSPRPQARPASLTLSRAPVPAEARAPVPADADTDPVGLAVSGDATGFEIAAADLAAGTRLAQLGAFDSADLARAEWARLTSLYPDFFLGRARVIEEAATAGQTFYRLRAHGFGDLSASRRFCAALVAEGAVCIPVTVR